MFYKKDFLRNFANVTGKFLARKWQFARKVIWQSKNVSALACFKLLDSLPSKSDYRQIVLDSFSISNLFFVFSLDVDETTALVMASILFCAVGVSLIEESCFMLILSCCVTEIAWIMGKDWITNEIFFVARGGEICSWSFFWFSSNVFINSYFYLTFISLLWRWKKTACSSNFYNKQWGKAIMQNKCSYIL